MSRRIMIDEQMLVSAARYALGRATYIVGTTIDSIKTAWADTSERARGVIERDIRDYLDTAACSVQRDYDGAEWRTYGDYDDRAWAELLAWIEAQCETALVCSKHGEPWPCPAPEMSCVPVDEADRC